MIGEALAHIKLISNNSLILAYYSPSHAGLHASSDPIYDAFPMACCKEFPGHIDFQMFADVLQNLLNLFLNSDEGLSENRIKRSLRSLSLIASTNLIKFCKWFFVQPFILTLYKQTHKRTMPCKLTFINLN